MKRRDFVKQGLAGSGAALAASTGLRAGAFAASPEPPAFTLDYAPHFGLFAELAGDDPVAQLEFAAEQGFSAWEDNGMSGRPVEEQERIADAMERLGIDMGVFVAHTIHWDEPSLTTGKAEYREQFLEEIRASVDVAKRVNATWMTVVPGDVDPRLPMGYQTGHVVDALRQAAGILAPHDLVMVLEPLNPHVDHPEMYLTNAAQAYALCRAVNSPSCKILYDMYHQQISEGHLIPNLELAWDEIAYLQIGDNPGRNEPTTGEIHYANIFEHIYAKGYDGILGMEHGQSKEGAEGERAVLEAYRTCDPEPTS